MRLLCASLVVLLAVLLGLQGCVTAPVISGSAATVNRADAAALQNWQASGRLGVSAPAQSGSGAFTWRQTGAATHLSVRGPAGIGALTIEAQQGVLRVQSADGQQFDAAAALAELSLRLGGELPVTQLQYWLRGVVAPATQGEAGQWLEAGQVLQQQGWLIRYEEWATRGALRLPTRLVLTSDPSRSDEMSGAAADPANSLKSADQPEVRIVVRVQSWQVH